MAESEIAGIELDLAANTIRLHLEAGEFKIDHTGMLHETHDATLDVGTGGRLLGVEVGDSYLTVSDLDAAEASLVRSVDIAVTVVRRSAEWALAWVDVPRAGEGFEITWPSGNQ